MIDAAGAIGIALCGLGPQCSIPGGDSSDAGLALRRQAVELSLYAFKYVDEVDSVVVFLPPSSGRRLRRARSSSDATTCVRS